MSIYTDSIFHMLSFFYRTLNAKSSFKGICRLFVYCITSAELWVRAWKLTFIRVERPIQDCDAPLNTDLLPHENLILFTLIFTSRALKCRCGASIKSFQVWMKTLFEFSYFLLFCECMIYQFMALSLQKSQSSDIFTSLSLALFTSIYSSSSTDAHTQNVISERMKKHFFATIYEVSSSFSVSFSL
jgi:hypothetical protein